MIKILTFILSLNIQLIFASDIFRTNENFKLIQNSLNKEEVLLLYKEKSSAEIFNIKSRKVTRSFNYDKRCIASIDNFKTLFVGTFLVNAETLCFFNSNTKKIEFVKNQQAPINSFSLSYIEQDSTSYYLALNGRDFDSPDEGYIKLKIINKKTKIESTQELITHVPGFSGAMIKQEKHLLYTKSYGREQNQLYKLKISKLIGLYNKSQTNQFLEVAKPFYKEFSGLSFDLFVKNGQYIYYNQTPYGKYPSYILNIKTGERLDFSIDEGCRLIGIYSKEMIMNCWENTIRLEKEKA